LTCINPLLAPKVAADQIVRYRINAKITFELE
jgi:hypothetical protein